MERNKHQEGMILEQQAYLKKKGTEFEYGEPPPSDMMNQVIFYPPPISLHQHELSRSENSYGTHTKNNKTKVTQLSKKQRNKEATAKYREKKKMHLQQLQNHIKELEEEISTVNDQIEQEKNKIVLHLETVSKKNKRKNQNEQIFEELRDLIYNEDHPDIDKINLLVDTLKYRIGASGKQREAKLNYVKRNIVNTFYPALYRYLLYLVANSKDIFYQREGEMKQGSWQKWTTQVYEKQKVQLTEQQFNRVQKYRMPLLQCRSSSLEIIKKMKEIINKFKDIQVEDVEQYYRQKLTPIQSTKWILFSEKYKYKEQVFFDQGFNQQTDQRKIPSLGLRSEPFSRVKEEPEIQGKKRVHLTML